MIKARYFAGDTLVEVMFAVTVFSMVAIGGLAIMNQGTSAAQRSLEISLVRAEIDAQAEALRFLNNAYIAGYRDGVTSYSSSTPAGQWTILRQTVSSANLARFSDNSVCTPPPGSFVIDVRQARVVRESEGLFAQPQTFSQLRYRTAGDMGLDKVEGIWVEGLSSSTTGASGYIDLYIRACWPAPGQSVPLTTGSIVRLYEPR